MAAEQVLPHQNGPVVLREEAPVVGQNGQPRPLVQSVGGIDDHGIEGPLFQGLIFQHHVHSGDGAEIQPVEPGEGVELHAALLGEELVFRPKAQVGSCGGQVAEGGQAVFPGRLGGDAHGIGVVQAHLAQQPQAVLRHLGIHIVKQALPGGDIGGVPAQEGGEHRAVIGEHQIAAGGGAPQGIIVVHLGHLIPDVHS